MRRVNKETIRERKQKATGRAGSAGAGRGEGGGRGCGVGAGPVGDGKREEGKKRTAAALLLQPYETSTNRDLHSLLCQSVAQSRELGV